MKLGFTSDFHGWLPSEVSDCDVLFIGGDICPLHNHDETFQSYWLDDVFHSWLESLPMEVVGIAGNHDFVAETVEGREIMVNLPWYYLENEGMEIFDLKVWGSPMSNQFGRWAFMAEDEVLDAIVWKQIPRQLDVLMTHGPAYGLLDKVNNNWSADRHAGSKSLRKAVLSRRPKIHLVGHIHEGYGQTKYGWTTVVNGSYNDERYSFVKNPIQVIEV